MLQKISLFLFFSLILCAEEYFVVFLVNARGLDYSSPYQFLKTVAKHPRDGSKNGDVGHAWVYLHGDKVLEGGHSGERGVVQPCYWEGVLDNCILGAKDPVSYLWCGQIDGFFQEGNGGHRPTFAAKVSLTSAQYESICAFIESYPFDDYSLTGNQCCTFVRKMALLLDIVLEDRVTLEVPSTVTLAGKTYRMWEDPQYQALTFSAPDRLEKSLRELVEGGRAEDVLEWYRKTQRKCWKCRMKEWGNSFWLFPERLIRYYELL